MHNPTPWRIDRVSRIDNEVLIVIVDADGEIVASGMTYQNATLIVRSVNGYDALQRSVLDPYESVV